MSLRVAVLLREGLGGGGEVPVDIPFDLRVISKECWRGSSLGFGFAAKGSCWTILGEGLLAETGLRTRGFGFWRELRTLGGMGLDGGEESIGAVGVFALKEEGGGGAAREGMYGECLAASAAWRFASARRAEYSWMDSREGRWYSTVIFDWRRG